MPVIDPLLELESFRQLDPQTIDKESLVDIRDISIKEGLSREERMADFLSQIKNPYWCRCGDLVVQSVFADTDQTLTDRLQQYFKTL